MRLTAAHDGASGLAIARALKPDLILLDVDMPGTNGFDVCARLKQDEATRRIPVVFLTGASTTDEKLRGLDLGAVDYIIKPFDPAELRARVRASLRTKHLLDLLQPNARALGQCLSFRESPATGASEDRLCSGFPSFATSCGGIA